MTLASIMKLALRQLDEAAEDISEYDELFKSYANMGYMIALKQFLRPRETLTLKTDKSGRADIRGMRISRVIEVCGEAGRHVWFDLTADGCAILTQEKEKKLSALCEMERAPLESDMDEPAMPQWAHAALADYICYRHLSSGNLAKQSRAEFFRQSFYQQMRALKPQGAGSVTRMKNLYSVTDVRYRR
ncbi:MAG: hypothetical protein IJB85_06445 [Clostridia bacterium]|nr:hypothetical protein [Clostridia bacterium]